MSGLDYASGALRKMSFRTKLGHFAMVGGWFYLRACFAGVLCGAIVNYLVGWFAERAKTDDWVLEYRHWISAGIYVIGAAMWIGFMLITRSPKPEPDERGTDHE